MKLNHHGLFWVGNLSCMRTKVTINKADHNSALKMWQKWYFRFIFEECLRSRECSFRATGWVLISTDLVFVWNTIFPCFHKKCFFDPGNVPLTPEVTYHATGWVLILTDPDANKQTDRQPIFFHMTLLTVEGITPLSERFSTLLKSDWLVAMKTRNLIGWVPRCLKP